jgi:hypothetical protein
MNHLTDIIYSFAALGLVVSVIFTRIIILDIIRINKKRPEVDHVQTFDVYDIPTWQPMNPIAKQSNRTLNKMYKGKMRDELCN